jgi:hypothetical protein
MTKQILAFHNKQSLKQETVSRMKEHIKLDQLVQGTGYNKSSGKGCAVGCAIDCYDHQTFADKLGVDLWIPYFYDMIHEGLSSSKFEKFVINFLNSIPVGMSKEQSDLIKLKLFYFMLTKIIPYKFQKYKEIADIIDLFKQSIEGVNVTREQWVKTMKDLPFKNSVAVVDAAAAAAWSVADAAAAWSLVC